MPIKNNRFFNSPAMAQAAANLSSMFEPPSGSDEAGWARARADDLQTGQREALWKYMQDPNADLNLISTGGIIADLYDWGGSKYGVDTGAATQRYGYDTAAKTQLANNAADNVRALQLGREQALMQPIGENETQFRPPSIADLFDVPESQTGVVGAAQGEKLVLPDGTVVEGQPKPLSETEVKGGLLTDIIGRQSSQETADQLILDSILGTGVEQTVGPDGKPIFTRQREAPGEMPVPKESSAKTSNYVAVTPDGKEQRFVGYVGQDNKVYDVNTNQPVRNVMREENESGGLDIQMDADGRLTSIRTGGAAGGPREFEAKAGFAATMLEEPTRIIIDAFDNDKLPALSDVATFQVINKMATADSFAMAAATPYMNALLSDEGQTFFAAMQQALPYELMVRSGQAVHEGEYARKLIAMIPLPSDNPDTKAIKRNAFLNAQAAINRLAGGAAPEAAAAPAGAPVAPAAAPAAVAPAALSAEEEWVRDPATGKLTKRK